MPNPVPAEYTVQLGPTVTPEVAGELAAWGELLGRSTSKVAREAIDAGLEVLRADWRATAVARGTATAKRGMPAATLARHVRAAQERGRTQVGRRRAYDERTRKAQAEAEVQDEMTETEQRLVENPELVERIEHAMEHPETLVRRGPLADPFAA